MVEYKFCIVKYYEENGRITRTLRRNSRNTKENPYAHTSLIVDLSLQASLALVKTQKRICNELVAGTSHSFSFPLKDFVKLKESN